MNWSTDSLPPSERFDHWREVVCGTFFHLTPERPKHHGLFKATIQSQPLASASVTHIIAGAQHVERREADIARDPTSSVCLNVQVSGRGHVQQGRHATVLTPGEACLMSTSEPFRLRFDDDFHQIAVHLPRAVIDPYIPCHDVLGRALPASPMTALAVGYTRAGQDVAATSSAAERLIAHLCEVIGMAVTGETQNGSTQGALLAAAIDQIGSNLTDPALAPALIAHRLSVSVRTLHAVFRGHDTTFSQEVLHQRLALARRLLADPTRRGLRIVDISAETGFADRSHFHRTFRAAFGQTPDAYRRALVPTAAVR